MIHKLSVVISLMLFTNWFVILFLIFLIIIIIIIFTFVLTHAMFYSGKKKSKISTGIHFSVTFHTILL